MKKVKIKVWIRAERALAVRAGFCDGRLVCVCGGVSFYVVIHPQATCRCAACLRYYRIVSRRDEGSSLRAGLAGAFIGFLAGTALGGGDRR